MCGIFGIVSDKNTFAGRSFQESLTDLFLLSESRGKEASGFACVKDLKIEVYKNPFPASQLVKSGFYSRYFKDYSNSSASFFATIGHSRLVTDGYEHENKNNQPVVKDNFVVVHNGIVVNHKELWQGFAIEKKETDLDTEIIPVILSAALKESNNIFLAFKELYRRIYGMTSIAILNSSQNELYLATNNGSLYYYHSEDEKIFIFASEFYILNQILTKFKHNDGSINKISQLIPNSVVLLNLKSCNLVGYQIESENLPFLEVDKKCEREITLIINEELKSPLYINTSFEHMFKTVSKEFELEYQSRFESISKLKRCSKCILPSNFPYIDFDREGVCNYCRNYHKIEYLGEDKLQTLLQDYRRIEGIHDCLMPFSGGRDSSYALHIIKKVYGLNPLAFSYDWGMITDLARRNQSRMCGKLGVEHILISADIRKKRDNIRKNVSAWLKRPHLGTIPLFMAGDKQYFYYSNLLLSQNGLNLSILGENHLETTNFKSAFCGIKPQYSKGHTYSLTTKDKLKMMAFYGKEYVCNPAYINSSMLDTLDAFKSYYVMDHKTINLFNYLTWDENIINDTLRAEYDWETDPGTKTTWRIGDGTAAFYNYIYFMVAGFTENDTFRSNQIREGIMTRESALELSRNENAPRWDSLQWYCNTIKIEFEKTIKIINNINTLFR